MKKSFFLFLMLGGLLFSQENKDQYKLDFNYYYASILPHSPNILHLVTGHPEGVLLSVNKKTFGKREWESRLNYPDLGLSLHYQNNKNDELGDLYGLFAHLNFYFLKRNLQLRVGQGIAYNTNPYDKEKNYRNYAFSTHLMPSTFFMLNYDKENLFDGFGLRAGFFLFHHSNGTIKSPNTSINTVGANVGVSYLFDSKTEKTFIPREKSDSVYSEPIHFNVFFRSGVNESRTVGSGQFPFYVFSFYGDKRISRTSAFQAGVDVFLSMMLRNEIKMISATFPELNVDPDTDYKRVGAFVGYEFHLDRLSAEFQYGFYIYDDYGSNGSVYQRLGLKYRFYKNFFVETGLKTHYSKAEALEFSIGTRF